MRHLFDDWPRVAARLRSAPTIALFLDFDGTLAHLRPRPEMVSADPAIRTSLAALAHSPRFRIWIVSGRRQADVRARLGVPRIRYLGLCGWERGDGDRLPEGARRWLVLFRSRLAAGLADIDGAWIEDKEFALSVHYREVAAGDVERARAVVKAVVAPAGDQFRIERGKKVWEILPRELDGKGAASRRELATLHGQAVPLCLGDDRVDEPAFIALRAGVTVRVGRVRPSRARYRLAGVVEVRMLLDRLRVEFT